MIFKEEKNALIASRQGEIIRIEAWGRDSVRIRSTMNHEFTGNVWALTEKPETSSTSVRFEKDTEGEKAFFSNGRIEVTINSCGVISIVRDNKTILAERYRNYGGTLSKESRCLKYRGREFKGIPGGDFSLSLRFESTPYEKIFGMGQYQQPNLNLKGCILDLEQRNSQVTVPFAVSDHGYGFLWNNPAVGKAVFGANMTEWTADATKEMDYWVTVGDTPKEIIEKYTAVTGRAPMMPEDLMGLWQCKLRYRTQQEVLDVVKACREHDVPIDAIVIDFFHWPYQGSWRFDEKYWPDPKTMVEELHAMGVKVCVSVWPSVDKRSENYYPMKEQGLLVQNERGGEQIYDYMGDCGIIDATNPATRDYVWSICKKYYDDIGIDMYWLDNSEPDIVKYDFDNLRYYAGPGQEVSNIYPQYYSRMFYENEKAENKTPVNLLRSAWAGSQKYANVLWSGDVPSTFEALRDQISAGLNMGLAGIPWWNTDIGGFMTDDVNDPDFRELLIRWFEYAVFTPVLRMHGDRGPYNIPNLDDRDYGGGSQHTGQPNELWSYGEENFKIMRRYLDVRLSLHDYIKSIYNEASENGSPLLRTLFFEFPEDKKAWDIDDQYMFGPKLLVAPILKLHQTEREVYLPEGKWQDFFGDTVYDGGTTIKVNAALEQIPVFKRI